MSESKIKFTACTHLDFSDNYVAEKNGISINGGTKVCWNRPVIDETFPRLVQFCKLRGRLNYPTACLCKADKMCHEYKDGVHEVGILK